MNDINHLLIATSTTTWCVSFSTFASLVGIPIVFGSSKIGWKICVITAGIKNYTSIINKKKKKHGKIVLLATFKFSSIGVLISRL